jgi:U3 small nucleolar RNA-associated protein 13
VVKSDSRVNAELSSSEQDYQNYVSLKDYKRAIQLALAMAQPGRLLNLFNRVYESRDGKSITGSIDVDTVLHTLSAKDLVRLLKFVRDWNTKAKTSGVAQRILETVVRYKSPNDLVRLFEVASSKQAVVDEDVEESAEPDAEPSKRPRATTADLISLQDLLDGLLPYTERHLNRVERTLVDSYMVDYILGEMDGGVFDLGSLEVDEVDATEMAVDL